MTRATLGMLLAVLLANITTAGIGAFAPPEQMALKMACPFCGCKMAMGNQKGIHFDEHIQRLETCDGPVDTCQHELSKAALGRGTVNGKAMPKDSQFCPECYAGEEQ